MAAWVVIAPAKVKASATNLSRLNEVTNFMIRIPWLTLKSGRREGPALVHFCQSGGNSEHRFGVRPLVALWDLPDIVFAGTSAFRFLPSEGRVQPLWGSSNYLVLTHEIPFKIASSLSKTAK